VTSLRRTGSHAHSTLGARTGIAFGHLTPEPRTSSGAEVSTRAAPARGADAPTSEAFHQATSSETPPGPTPTRALDARLRRLFEGAFSHPKEPANIAPPRKSAVPPPTASHPGATSVCPLPPSTAATTSSVEPNERETPPAMVTAIPKYPQPFLARGPSQHLRKSPCSAPQILLAHVCHELHNNPFGSSGSSRGLTSMESGGGPAVNEDLNGFLFDE